MIQKINHIAIAVPNLEEACAFYEQHLGLKVTHIEEVTEQKVRAAFIPIGEVRIELLEPTAADSPIQKFLEQRGGGLHHICLQTDDVSADLARLEQQGVRLIDRVPRQGAHQTRIAFIHPKANNGVLTELAEVLDTTEDH